MGYKQVGFFLEISDSRQGVECEPDMVFYDGTNLLLVEVKSGRNVNQRAIEQMKRCDALSVEAASNFLSDAEVADMGIDPNSLSNIEPVVVYYADVMEECQESDGCRSQLDTLADHGSVLSQAKGGKVTTVRDSFDSSTLSNFFTKGIEVPALPETNFFLTDNVNREVLAYSIAHDTVLPNLNRNSEITISPEDVIKRYRHRKIPFDKLSDSLQFLSKIGACVDNGDGTFTFSKSRMSEILSVESRLKEKRVLEVIESEEIPQATLIDDWTDSEGATTDGGKGTKENEKE